MSDTIRCDEHGEQPTTFVCQHLAQSLKTRQQVGMCWSGTLEERSDAWCSQCEEVRVREGGDSGEWNDRSEAFAKIALLCGACYDEVRKLQGF